MEIKKDINKECQRIGLNILIHRRELHMKQNDLAELSGISRGHISAIERGRTNFRIEVIIAISKALGVDYQELLR